MQRSEDHGDTVEDTEDGQPDDSAAADQTTQDGADAPDDEGAQGITTEDHAPGEGETTTDGADPGIGGPE